MPPRKQLRGRSVLTRDSPIARRTRPRNAFMNLQIEEDAPANPLIEASQSFSQDSDLIYGSSSQADNSDNRVSLFTAPPSLSNSPLLCVPSPAPRDPAPSTPRTAEDVDTSTTVQNGSSPTPTTPRPNQRDGAAPLSSLSPLLLPPFSPPPSLTPSHRRPKMQMSAPPLQLCALGAVQQ